MSYKVETKEGWRNKEKTNKNKPRGKTLSG
jgi:hypothetical protein